MTHEECGHARTLLQLPKRRKTEIDAQGRAYGTVVYGVPLPPQVMNRFRVVVVRWGGNFGVTLSGEWLPKHLDRTTANSVVLSVLLPDAYVKPFAHIHKQSFPIPKRGSLVAKGGCTHRLS